MLSKKGERCGSGSKHNRGEQMCLCLEMTDCASLRQNQTKSKRNFSDHGKVPRAGQAMYGAPGLTHKSCFALSYGSTAVCKVEKKPRKKQRCMSA